MSSGKIYEAMAFLFIGRSPMIGTAQTFYRSCTVRFPGGKWFMIKPLS
jgi:hypothetical protein